jgi:hypothetical protein
MKTGVCYKMASFDSGDVENAGFVEYYRYLNKVLSWNAATSSWVGRSNQPTPEDKGTTFLQNVKIC